ncbi:unnamed protein product [Paramecium sonneborni]|uniref:Uncharacterized protein n=1 Tax=Paramecium sonneborni TaxID=65129 RepID=A0A8S1R997_9CILI|nr:unnamed protein product [Paramecium sonneborni]
MSYFKQSEYIEVDVDEHIVSVPNSSISTNNQFNVAFIYFHQIQYLSFTQAFAAIDLPVSGGPANKASLGNLLPISLYFF